MSEDEKYDIAGDLEEAQHAIDDWKPSTLTFDMLRVTPNPNPRDKNPSNDRLTDLLIILFILGISIWYRFYFRQAYLDTYGIYVFHLQIAESDPLGFGSFFGLAPGESFFSEGYHDFYSYYIPYVEAFEDGWNPYTGNREPGDRIGGYVYGPFYMLSIAAGRIWFGMSVIDSIVFSNIILDALCYVMVYILAKRYTGNIVAAVVALLGSFSPISLFFIAYRGLNAPIMNFSFLLFIYFYLEKRDNLSMIMLAFSLLTKQFPLFMAMPAGLWMVRRYGFFKGVSYYLRFFIAVLVLSVPYILWTPRSYIVRLFLPGGSKDVPSCPTNAEATNLFHGMIPDGACIPVNNGFAPLDTGLLPPGHELIFWLVNSHVLFFGSLIILAYIGFTAYDYLEERPRLYLVFFSAYYAVAHATIARGIYKYYITFLIPLMLLGFVFGDRSKSLNLRLGYILSNAWRTWLSPRYRQKEATPTYWAFLGFLVLLTLGVIWLVNSAISMFTFNTDKEMFWRLIFIPMALYAIFRPGGEQEEDNLVSAERYGQGSIVFLGVAIISYFILKRLMELYFNTSELMNQHILMMAAITAGFIALPIMLSKLTNQDQVVSPFTFNPVQLVSDIGAGLLVYLVVVFFHIRIMAVHRYDSTLMVLLFSFIPMALLGNTIWSSGYHAARRFFREYRKIYRYVNLRNEAFY
ncbi:MAG: glycosyltransferase family 39 protein [Candidatus Kariarchaeaceae archaeon]|jgi:hypothetical protein